MLYFYLLPARSTGNGKLVLEYHLVIHPLDMRTRFCKIYKNYRIDLKSWFAIERIPEYNDMIIKHDIDKDRIIAPNGKVAYAFQRAIEENLGYKS